MEKNKSPNSQTNIQSAALMCVLQIVMTGIAIYYKSMYLAGC